METLLNPKEIKAVKEHYCNEKILVGSNYLKSTHKHDGRIYDFKTHNYCAKLAEIFNMYEDCEDGVTQDDFMETIENKHDDILIAMLPQDDLQKYSDIIQQLRKDGKKNYGL